MKILLTILILFSIKSYSQSGVDQVKDSIKVKIKKIDGYKVTMKTMERPRVILFTFCKCPYRKKEIVWIKKP